MKYRIDYNLKGHPRFWICETADALGQVEAFGVLIQLHVQPDALAAYRPEADPSFEGRRAAVQNLGISDVRITSLD